MRYSEIIEGEIVPLPLRRKKWRHLIDVIYDPRHRTHHWAVYVMGERFTAYQDEQSSIKVANEKESELDHMYVGSFSKTHIVCLGNKEWILLNSGNVVGTYPNVIEARNEAEKIEPQSKLNHWISYAKPRDR